jgi:hypothetical protein
VSFEGNGNPKLWAVESPWSNGVLLVPFTDLNGYPEIDLLVINDKEYLLVRKVYNNGIKINKVMVEIRLSEIDAKTKNPEVIYLEPVRLSEEEFSSRRKAYYRDVRKK